MFGLGGERPTDDPMGPMMELFDSAGYIGVVATNCEQTYHRYLRPGEQVSIASEMRDVVGPKQTALGEGWFINQHITWRVGDEDVAEMEWRILKFKPRENASAALASVPADLDANAMMRPAVSRDTAFFWEGVKAHELRIQKLADGSLQHPPVPALWQEPGRADRLCGVQRQGHGVQLRGAPRAEGARSHVAVRHRAGRTRGRRPTAGRTAQCRPRRGEDRNARPRNIYRFPGRRQRAGVESLRLGALGGQA